MVWYTFRMDSLFTNLIDTEVAALQAVGSLEKDLVAQKGFVSYYFIDGNPTWLKQLNKYRFSFREQLARVRKHAQRDTDLALVNQVESVYDNYVESKDRVIDYYKAGEKEAGIKLHQEVRAQYFKILELCQQYKKIHDERIQSTREESASRAQHLRLIALTAMWVAFLTVSCLAVILLYQVLGPLRMLALETDRSSGGGEGKPGDEVVALKLQVRDLVKDMEKFALVGKLAAGVAHSIRNPLTSVKMRLFSLEQTLKLAPAQKDDFEVISEEIRHIDTIVQNFLEFSRPPKLIMQKVSPSDVVDNALQLLRHRLESYEVEITLKRQTRLPDISADPEQLKEVFVNLIVNACEAMIDGGSMVIHEEEGEVASVGRVVVIRLSDDGPGIPKSVQDKVFHPFFSTKEEGTGLGLTIATRILTEHGGWLEVDSEEGEGATFIINLPLEKKKNEHNFDS